MKSIWIFLILIIIFCFGVNVSNAEAKRKSFSPQFISFHGKFFTGIQDPEFIDYDLTLRNYLTKRIIKRFGFILDPKTYSGFDLLEIESLFKCKKSAEPFEIFLKMFPKTP